MFLQRTLTHTERPVGFADLGQAQCPEAGPGIGHCPKETPAGFRGAQWTGAPPCLGGMRAVKQLHIILISVLWVHPPLIIWPRPQTSTILAQKARRCSPFDPFADISGSSSKLGYYLTDPKRWIAMASNLLFAIIVILGKCI